MKRTFALVISAVLLSSCGSHGSGSAQSASTLPPSLPAVAKTQLQSALLTAAEVGSAYTATPVGSGSGSGGQTHASGCSGLARDINGGNSGSQPPGTNDVEADFQAGQQGPFVVESLISEPGRGFEGDYAKTVAEVKACKSLTIASSGISLTFRLTPVDFGSGATAARLDGTFHTLSLNGYLAAARVRNVGILFFYFQIGSGSSQEASGIFAGAISKVTTNLGS